MGFINKKKKTLSEVLNEQFSHKDRDVGDSEALEQPPVEEDFEGEEGDRRSLGKKATRSAGLRRRGALDDTLTTGKYAAKPVSMEEAESRMDDIFGALDEDDGDADDLYDDLEDGEGEGEGKKGGKKKKIMTQEEFEEEWEAKKKLRPTKKLRADGTSIRPAGAAEAPSGKKGASATENSLLSQIKELRARQKADMNLVAGDDDDAVAATAASSSSAAPQHTAADVLRASVATYQHLLHLRVKLQPLVQRAARFPQHDAFQQYEAAVEEAAEKGAVGADTTFAGLADDIKETIVDLLKAGAKMSMGGKNAALIAACNKLGPNASAQQLFKRISEVDADFTKDVNACIEHWGARTAGVAAKGGAFKAIHQPLLDQIRAVIVGKARLLNKAQRNRSHVAIFGHKNNEKSAAERAADIAAGDLDEELFDDADFLKELVHRSGSMKLKEQQADVESAAQRALKESGIAGRSSSSIKSKGRTISFTARPKLVGYMAPVPYAVGQQHEALLRSLFQ